MWFFPSRTARCCTCWRRCRCCASRCPVVDPLKPAGSPSERWMWSRLVTSMKACWIILLCAPTNPCWDCLAHARKNRSYRCPPFGRKKAKARRVFWPSLKSKLAVQKTRCAKPCRKDRTCSPTSTCSSPATTMQRCWSGWRRMPACCARMTLATRQSSCPAACM